MSRPLLISDCDEVLLHMVKHFSDWVDGAHGIEFSIQHGNFVDALRHRATGELVKTEDIWTLVTDFFDSEMDRQTLVPHALEALERIGQDADIVILTNLMEKHNLHRVDQLGKHGIRHRVICNQGGKGDAVKRLIDEYQPSVAVFVDDTAGHHDSVARKAPEVWRLHMIAEPDLAKFLPPSPHAHARIDDWADALPWILDKFAGKPA